MEEESDINSIHDKVGNKWAMIAKTISENHNSGAARNDNFIKNHFFSKMRKALRRINKEILVHFGKSIKPIRESIIFKIMEITDERFKKESGVPKEIIELSLDLKTSLYKFLDDISVNGQAEKLKHLVKQTEYFLNNYRKTEKRSRKGDLSS